MISLKPIFSDEIMEALGSEFNPLGESGLLLLLLTIILGFTLTSLNTFFYKLFEGYVLLWRIQSLRVSEIKRSRGLKKEQDRILKKAERLKNQVSRRAERRRNDLLVTHSALLAKYDLSFPSSEDAILPTKFGNILRAAELYPMSRYRIDSVPMWPRLIDVMPAAYYSKVDDVNNQLSFLMNCTVLAVLYAFITLGVSIYGFTRSIYASIVFPANPWVYFGLFLAAVSVGIVFLRACELVVTDYGLLIRASFDLFRRDLLRKLEFSPPLTLKKEQSLWEDICTFMNIGDLGGLIDCVKR